MNCMRTHVKSRSSNGRSLRDAFRRLVAAQALLDDVRRPCGAPLSATHAFALLTLREATSPLSVGELADQLSIDRSNVSRLCVKLERLNHVSRKQHPDDGRARAVQLTPEGRKLAEFVDRSSERHFAEVAEALGSDVGMVVTALGHLESAIRSQTDADLLQAAQP